MSNSEESLRTIYARAQDLEQQLATLQTTSDEYHDNVRAALSAYEECKKVADGISLFSPNETLEDLASLDIQYLSISYHIGEVLQKDNHTERKFVLNSARSAYDDFLNLLDHYGILSVSDRKTYTRYQDDKDSFSVIATSEPSKRRDAKIALLKDEKSLKQKLEHLRQNPSILSHDDDALRELRLAEIALQVHQTFQALDFIAQELKILAMAPVDPLPSDPRALAEDHRQRMGRPQDMYSDRLDPSVRSMLRNGKAGPILDSKGRPMQPFVLLDRRQDLRNGVFRPGHSLPTMSIDEYLEEERRRGGIIEGGGEPPAVEPNEDDLEAADRETMKQREWDEFKEENPRGSGNTLNKG